MKAICPNNKNHTEFITTGHVMQDWKVDNEGNFLEVVDECLQVTHGADVGNIWSCATCGTEAIVED